MQSEIKRWGNSAAVRLSSRILARANLEVASPVNIEVKGNRIIIEPAEQNSRRIKLPFSEADLLKGLDAHTGHADEVTVPTAIELGD